MDENYIPYGPEWEKAILKLNKTQMMNMLKQSFMKSSQLEPLVMQLAAFIYFLCQYHEDAKKSRNKIALASTLEEAREAAMFDYPVAQGIEFNMDIYKIAQAKLNLNENGNIQKAVEYMLKLSSQSA